MTRRTLAAAAAAILCLIAPVPTSALAAFADPSPGSVPTIAPGGYAWPVEGPILRGFEPPPDPYSAGHRGIDIGAPFGSTLLAAQDGIVAFAGYVAGALYISIDHPDGVRTTYSWLSAVAVRKGQTVVKGQVIGNTGHGHPDVVQPHLHFGARI